MGIEIGELEALLKLRDEMSDKLKDAAKETGAFESVFSGSMGSVMKLAGLGVAAIGAIGASVIALGMRGADIKDVSDTLDHFSGSAANSAEIMAKMREGTKGTIDDFALMKDASKLLSTGVKLTADDFGTLTAAAFVLQNRGLGSTKEMLDSVSEALVTGRTKTVARMLGVVDANAAEQDYASKLGVSKDALSDAGKVEAKRIEIMAMLRDAVKDAGTQELDFGEKLERVQASMTNAVDEMGVAIATSPVLGAVMTAAGDAMVEAFGSNQTDTIKVMIGYINDGAIALVGLAQTALSVAKFFNDAFYGTREIFANILGAVLNLASGFLGLINTVADVGAKIPGIGDSFKGAADATKDWKTWIDGAADGLKGFGEDAIDTAGKHDAAIDSMNGALESLKGKMVEASQKEVDNAAIVNKLGDIHKQAAQTVNAWTASLDAAIKKNAEVNAQYDAAVAHGVSYTKIMDLMGDGIKDLIKNHDLLGTKLPATWGVAIELLTRVTDMQDKERAAVKAVYDEIDKHAPDTAKIQIDSYVAGQVAAEKWRDDLVDMTRDVTQKQIDSIEKRRDDEIRALGSLKMTNRDVYDQIVQQIRDSADQMIAITGGANRTQEEQLRDLGAKTKEEQRGIAENARNAYEAMAADPEHYSQSTIEHFREIAREAARCADDTGKAWENTYTALDAGQEVLGMVGGKFGEMGTIAIDTFKNVAGALEKGDVFGAIVAGAMGALKAVKALFGGVSELEQKGREAEKTFESAYGSFDNMMAAIGTAYAAQGLGAQQAQTDVLAMMAAEKQGAEAVKAAIQKINDVMNDQKKDAADLDTAIQTYKFSIEELGPTMQKQKLTEQAVQLENDFRLLAGSGINVNTVLEHMGGSINEFLQLAIKTGQEVPSEMQPILQKMIDNKELIDANGDAYTDLSATGVTFSETMTQGFQKVVDKLTDLINKIAGTTGALNAIPTSKNIDVNFNGHWNIPEMPRVGDNGEDVPGHAMGGVFASEHLARIAEGGKPEIVGDQDFMTAAVQRALINISATTVLPSSAPAPSLDPRMLDSLDELVSKFDDLPHLLARTVKSAMSGAS